MIKKIKKYKNTLIISTVAIFFSALVWFGIWFNAPHHRAILTVNAYLESMHKGDTKVAEKYLDYDNTLIDVFNYKYLDTLEKNDDDSDYILLYDTQIANGLGNKLYKKIEFEVERQDNGGWKITSFNIRGSDDEDDSGFDW